MTNTKHTPGPWTLEGGKVCGNGYYIATVNSHGTTEGRANATLMAAAPDLLEALEAIMDEETPLTGKPSHAQLVEHWEYEKSQGRGCAGIMLSALAAITKAEGRAS